MKLLYVGSLDKGSTCLSRMTAMTSIGVTIETFDFNDFLYNRYWFALAFYFGIGPAIGSINRAFLKKVEAAQPSCIWVDKGLYITPVSLKKIKEKYPEIKIVHLNPDDPYGLNQQGFALFKKTIPFYDVHFVSRPQNVEEYIGAGGKQVYEYDRSFDPFMHKPVVLSTEDARKYVTPVGFIGSYAKDRADMLLFLVKNNIALAIYGDRWEKYPRFEELKPFYRSAAVYGAEYAKAICGMDIAIHFLRKENRDGQDSRTYEIPACGTFMIAERSARHEVIFTEDEEAVFFDDEKELLEKIRYYMVHTEERNKIAQKGRERSLRDGYDHINRIKQLLEQAGIVYNMQTVDG